MKFYRKGWVSVNQLNPDSVDEFVEDLNNFGFVSPDGGAVRAVPWDNGEQGSNIYTGYSFKWCKDTTPQPEGFPNRPISTRNGFTMRLNATDPGFSFYDRTGTPLRAGDLNIAHNNTKPYHNFFFIPLINNGFIFADYCARYTVPNTRLTDLKQLCPTFLTPTNFIKEYMQVNHQQTAGGYGSSWCHCLVGVFNNVTNTMMYFFIKTQIDQAAGSFWNFNINSNSGSGITDFYIGKWSDQPIPYVSNDIFHYEDADNFNYTDISQNVCTLIRMPYQSSFLDNVYICTTCPNEHPIEGQFFSFGGRNFLGFYKNLVIELPTG